MPGTRTTVFNAGNNAASAGSRTITIAAGSFGDWASGDVVTAVASWGANTQVTSPAGFTYRGTGTSFTNTQRNVATTFASVVQTYTLTDADILAGVTWTWTIPVGQRFQVSASADWGLDTSSNDAVDVSADSGSAGANPLTVPTLTPTAGPRLVRTGVGSRWSSVNNGQLFTAPGDSTEDVSCTSAGGNPGAQIANDTSHLTSGAITCNGSTSVGGETYVENPANASNYQYGFTIAFRVAGAGAFALGTSRPVRAYASRGSITAALSPGIVGKGIPIRVHAGQGHATTSVVIPSAGEFPVRCHAGAGSISVTNPIPSTTLIGVSGQVKCFAGQGVISPATPFLVGRVPSVRCFAGQGSFAVGQAKPQGTSPEVKVFAGQGGFSAIGITGSAIGGERTVDVTWAHGHVTIEEN